jgi:hypothetical protein
MIIFPRFIVVALLLVCACAQQPQIASPEVDLPVPSATAIPVTPTIEITTTPTDLPTEIATTDPSLFGAIAQSEIQAYSLEPVAEAVFVKVMDEYIASKKIDEYEITGITVFPSSDGTLYAEISFNVRTTDPMWLEDGGTQANDNWINNKCNRFDFVTTETEFQLKNQRLCS